MADPTPLISPVTHLRDETATAIATTTAIQNPKDRSLSPNSTLDDIIEKYIGDFGWAQFLQAVLVSLAWAFDAQQTFISVFTDAVPSNMDCVASTRLDYHFQPYTSIISEWGLECSKSLITGLPTTSFFVGCLVGGLLLATLADSSSLGRKNMLILSTLLMSLAGLFTALISSNIWIYSAFRFVSGCGRANIGACALVLSTELVGRRWRGQVGVIGFLCFTIGFLSLPLIAYLTRGSSWRLLYLWTSGPAILYCIFLHLFVKESPRWLFVRGRRQEFADTLKSIAPSFCSFTGVENLLCTNIIEEENVGFYSSMKILLGKNWVLSRLSAVMAVGLGTGIVYYGMPLSLGNLDFRNIYVSVMLNALSELPASLATFFLIGRLNRKSLMLALTTLSGVCSVLCAVADDEKLQIGMEMVSFFSACTAFNILLIFTLELFPTCIRNSALSMVRQALVLGGAFSPMLVASGRKNVLFSYGVFGLSIGFCGFFVILVPETKGGTLCDTTEEEEYKIKQIVTGNSTCPRT